MKMYKVMFEQDSTHFVDWAYAEDIHGIHVLAESNLAVGYKPKSVRLVAPYRYDSTLWCCVQERKRDFETVSTFHKTFQAALEHAEHSEHTHKLNKIFAVFNADQG